MSLLLLCFGAEPSYADTVKIGGSGGPLAGMQRLMEAFKKAHPGTDVIIVGNLGSSGGIKAVLAGAIDIGVSSRPLRPTEIAQGALGIEYARSPFVFATAGKAPVMGMTAAELAGIYRGDIKMWPDGRALRLILRPEHDSDTDTLRGMSPEMKEAIDIALKRPGLIVAATDNDSIEQIEKIPGSLGTTTLAHILSDKRKLTPLALNDAAPSTKTLADGKYPLFKTFYLVTGASPTPSAKRFIAFVQSEAGKAILAQYGHWVAPTTVSRGSVASQSAP